MSYTREQIIYNLKSTFLKKFPIIGVAVGAGITAKYAEEGGADLLLTLNSGKFRQMGVGSFAGMLPFGNNNKIVEGFGTTEIIPIIKKTPVIFGLCATDPNIILSNYIDSIVKKGFSGIVNYPTIGLIDGNFRDALEELEYSFDKEIEALSIARQKGIFTLGFAFTPEQAKKMIAEDIDVICAHLGLAIGGEIGNKNSVSLEESVKVCRSIFDAIDKKDESKIKLVYGGPIASPTDAEYIYNHTSAMGYIGGSLFERVPTEQNLKKLTEQFKNYSKIKRENEKLKEELEKKISFDEIIGQSQAMQDLYFIIKKVAEKNINVLIQGESGTGKELVSKAIYKYSNRNTEPFIKINCASIPSNLLESEMFGYEHGAFTGATKRKIGRFELADKGILFLDEIAELSMELQAKLLRAIQEQEFERVGGNETVHVDIRIISATNKDIEKAVKEGLFREDLYYRLNGFFISIPSLRERKEDIPYLVKHLLDKINKKIGTNIHTASSETMDAFLNYEWPGNVRELENTLSRMAVMAEGSTLYSDYLPVNIKNTKQQRQYNSSDSPKFNVMDSVEKNTITNALKDNMWNISQTAKFLGITRKTLQNKIKKYEIKPIMQ